ncbi:hypothetical protein E4U53_007876 [Claviceps sorghi]|nr:hypothetical protein E4U53_007876 [Claviceps sorghi]
MSVPNLALSSTTPTATDGLLTSPGSTTSHQPLTAAFTPTASSVVFPQTTDGSAVSKPLVGDPAASRVAYSSSASAPASGTPAEPAVVFQTSPGQSPPTESFTNPAGKGTGGLPSPGDTTRVSLSTTNQPNAPMTCTSGSLLTTATPALPTSTALTSSILTSTTPTPTLSSTPWPSSAGPLPVTSLRPTGTPNTNIPTANTNFPTATTRVEPATYAHNLAQARNLNTIFSSLTPQSACSGTQMACIAAKVGRCSNGAFVLTDCPATTRCHVLPMTNTRGAKIACVEPADAVRILGPAAEGATSSSGPAGQPPKSTVSSPTTRPVVTHTRVVVVTDTPLVPVPLQPTSRREAEAHTAGLGSVTAEPLLRTKFTTTATPPALSSLSLSSLSSSSSPSSSPSSSSSSSPSSWSPPSTPPLPITASPHPTTNRPSLIVITQTFDPPPPAQTSDPPGILELIPVELSSLPRPAARITPIPLAKAPASFALAPGAPPASLPGPRTTVTNNGTPTVSVFLTVTVTQTEKETLRVMETVTVTVTAYVA